MQSTSGDGGNSPSPLHLALNHLSSSKGRKQLYNDAARGLHRASKDYQAAARATLRHLPLIKYHGGVVALHPDPSTRPSTMPWQLLAASPAAASWTLHPEQLEEFRDDNTQQLAAAAGQLRRLEVHGVDSMSDAQLQGLARLMHACSQLQAVHITIRLVMLPVERRKSNEPEPMSKPWLMMDPNSSSLSTALYPRIPLLSWESSGVPYAVMKRWLAQQQQQPGNTLTRLVMTHSGRPKDIRRLAAVPGLRELQLGSTKDMQCDSARPKSFMALHSMGSANPLRRLTRLVAPGAAVEAVCALTGLQHLSLGGNNLELTCSMSSMQQLTCLHISHGRQYVLITPDDLGLWLPNLQRLEGKVAFEGVVPASLTALTHLSVAKNFGRAPLKLPFALTRLKELVLQHVISVSNTGLTSVPSLELLEGLCCSSATLVQPLTRLRSLSINGRVDPSSLKTLGNLQQLSRLDVGCMYEPTSNVGRMYEHTSALTAIGPLPALQELTVGLDGCVDLWPWLRQFTALTRLCVVDRSFVSTGGIIDQGDLGYLPLQLQELRLQNWYGQQLPAGVARLACLTALYVIASPFTMNERGPCQLPSWLSQLCCLEVLDLSQTRVSTEQAVLAHMPALRCVMVSAYASAAEVCGSATHLCYGGGSVSVQ
jgi:hypothetical protein